MKTVKIKVKGGPVLKYRRSVAYRIKEGVSKKMRDYISFLCSHHRYFYEDLATCKMEIANYFEPYIEYENIS